MSISLSRLTVGSSVYFEARIKERIVTCKRRPITKLVRYPVTIEEIDHDNGWVKLSSFYDRNIVPKRYSMNGQKSFPKLFWCAK